MINHGKTDTLYVRGVGVSYIKKLQRDAKEYGYPTLGSYLNQMFAEIYDVQKTRDKIRRKG